MLSQSSVGVTGLEATMDTINGEQEPGVEDVELMSSSSSSSSSESQ